MEGLKARVAQHEMDHLNGIMIVDYLPKREKLRFMIEYEELMKEGKTISESKKGDARDL
ncbi:Peptide deformylase [subsurface metagenome]